jgi:hypothetical protein
LELTGLAVNGVSPVGVINAIREELAEFQRTSSPQAYRAEIREEMQAACLEALLTRPVAMTAGAGTPRGIDPRSADQTHAGNGSADQTHAGNTTGIDTTGIDLEAAQALLAYCEERGLFLQPKKLNKRAKQRRRQLESRIRQQNGDEPL